MKKHLIKPTTSGSAGTVTNHQLAESYLAHQQDLSSSNAKNEFGKELDKQLRSFLHDDKLGGVARGCEGDIRQAAALLLFERYLDGNVELRRAVLLKSLPDIQEQLLRSILGALEAAQQNLKNKATRHAVFLVKAKQMGCSPSDAGSGRRAQAVAEIQRWRRAKLLCKRNARILFDVFIHGVPRKAICDQYSISESGLSRLISRCIESIKRHGKSAELQP